MAIDRLTPPEEDAGHAELLLRLAGHGIRAVVVAAYEDLRFEQQAGHPQLALIDLTSPVARDEVDRWLRACRQMKLSTIALVPQERLSSLDIPLGVDDFVLCPANPDEVVSRARRMLRQQRERSAVVVRVGELVVDPESYEVSLAGRRIDLTFKEYELLRLLASNPGRLYTREALLNQIWGYEYFGGTRTVDVHIRRLRSKIDDAEHSFIETVWKAGYRFRDVGRVRRHSIDGW